MFYPNTDASFSSGSYKQFASGYFLSRDDMEWFLDQYLPDKTRRKEPLATPLNASLMNEVHVGEILRQILETCDIDSSFAMLACDTGPRPAYVLYIDTEAGDDVLHLAAQNIETLLCTNFHYQYARRLGQLDRVRIFRARQAASTYLANAVASGQRAGDVKPTALDRRNIWSNTFAGRFVDAPTRA